MSVDHNNDFANEIAELLKILSNPIRLKILALCSKKEMSSKELREILEISKPLLINHLRKLINMGLLNFRIEIDEKKAIVRKYYKSGDIEICINRKLFDEIAKKIQ